MDRIDQIEEYYKNNIDNDEFTLSHGDLSYLLKRIDLLEREKETQKEWYEDKISSIEIKLPEFLFLYNIKLDNDFIQVLINDCNHNLALETAIHPGSKIINTDNLMSSYKSEFKLKVDDGGLVGYELSSERYE